MEIQKKCNKCQRVLFEDDFHLDNSKSDRRSTYCKKCNAAALSKSYKDNSKHIEMMRTFGLTESDFNNLVNKFDKKCAICKTELDLCVDHDHATCMVRGILCRRCNAGLGMFQDSLEFLQSAIAYLEAHNKKPVDLYVLFNLLSVKGRRK